MLGRDKGSRTRPLLMVAAHLLLNPMLFCGTTVACVLASPPSGPAVSKQSIKSAFDSLGAESISKAAPVVGEEVKLDSIDAVSAEAMGTLWQAEGLPSNSVAAILRICAKAPISEHPHLEAMASRATGFAVRRNGRFSFGQAARVPGGGYITILHNLTGASGGLGDLTIGEAFEVLLGGQPFRATVRRAPPAVSLSGAAGPSDGVVYLHTSSTAR